VALLRTVGLRKSFGGLSAVDGVDFSVAEGEIVGLIGPNGAGKTTFVDLLTGVQLPSGGRILLDGEDITRLRSHERSALGLTRTFQVPLPFHDMTVIENVMVGALFGGRDPTEGLQASRAVGMRCLAQVGLEAMADRRTSVLTTAGRKRLEVARCLATSPRILFLDEPLGGLNPTEVKDALVLIRHLNERGVTIVFIEHIVPAVMNVSSRVFVLVNGRKLAEGTPDQIMGDGQVQRAYLGDVKSAVARRSGAPRRMEPRSSS
jgi:branched-chain amino acid transport system ATP-binding protein